MDLPASTPEAGTARRLRPVWIAGLAAAAIFAGLAAYLAPLEPGVVSLQLAFTPRAFGEIVHAWPAEHLLRYRRHLPWDCLLALAYACFGWMLVSRSAVFAGMPPLPGLAARLALPVAALFDIGENALHAWLTEVPRFGVPTAYAAAATFAALKWMLILGFAALALAAWARRKD